jgi:hypothetical protein
MKIQIEHTDTFGGEANYAWINRKTIKMPDNSSDLAIIRRVKKETGLSGVRCKVENYGDILHIKPRGICQIVFVNFVFSEKDEKLIGSWLRI